MVPTSSARFAPGWSVDRNRRRDAVDRVDLRLVHAVEELPRVGRERFHVTPLALGVKRVEHQRRFARSRDAGDDDQLVERSASEMFLRLFWRAPPGQCIIAVYERIVAGFHRQWQYASAVLTGITCRLRPQDFVRARALGAAVVLHFDEHGNIRSRAACASAMLAKASGLPSAPLTRATARFLPASGCDRCHLVFPCD